MLLLAELGFRMSKNSTTKTECTGYPLQTRVVGVLAVERRRTLKVNTTAAAYLSYGLGGPLWRIRVRHRTYGCVATFQVVAMIDRS